MNEFYGMRHDDWLWHDEFVFGSTPEEAFNGWYSEFYRDAG